MAGFDAGMGTSFMANVLAVLFTALGNAIKAVLPNIAPVWLVGGLVIFLVILYALRDQVKEYAIYLLVILAAIFLAASAGLFK